MSKPVFQLFTGRNDQYYFRLKAANGEIIGNSEGYVSKQGALNGISSVRTHSQYDRFYTFFNGRDGQYYFNLKASNGEIILASEGYQTRAGAENGKESVKRNAPIAEVLDLTTRSAYA